MKPNKIKARTYIIRENINNSVDYSELLTFNKRTKISRKLYGETEIEYKTRVKVQGDIFQDNRYWTE